MTRFKSWFSYRHRKPHEDELPWVRPADLATLDLPRPLVLTNGCFDVLHSGHMKVLAAARSKAATLVTALDSDQRVAALKGLGHPLQSWIERATSLKYMPIDYLVEFGSDQDFTQIMLALRPDLWVRGADHVGDPDPYPWVPKMFVRDGGMRTSEIIRRIQSLKQD